MIRRKKEVKLLTTLARKGRVYPLYYDVFFPKIKQLIYVAEIKTLSRYSARSRKQACTIP